MILLFGAMVDEVTAYICTRLLSKGVDFLLLDTRQYPQQFGLTWSIDKNGAMDGTVRYGSRELALKDIRSVCLRYIELADHSSNLSSSEEECSPADAYRYLVTFADTLPALVVNRPSSWLSNGSKPYQQLLISKYDFKVPRTLVTTIPEEARLFYEKCHRQVIYKSISSQRSIVQRMKSKDLKRLEQVRYCPTQFQEYIAGVEIRVHTIGSRVFATEITTDAIDYRYAAREHARRTMRAVDIPEHIAERCLRLANGLGLVMSGIDLRRNPDGEYYCLEVNPTPGFTFYENYTGQRMGDALVDLRLPT